jgi:ribosome modulation factor
MNDAHGTSDSTHEHDADQPTDSRGRVSDGPGRQSLRASRPASATDLLGPRLVLATQDQGYTAAWNGDHVNTCPWLTATTAREMALRQMWIRGYSAGRTDLRIAREPRPE